MSRTEAANQRIRDERTAQIIEVAARVFARKGLAETRISDIAAAGEMSQGLVYRYFTSKEEIFGTIVERTTRGTIRLARQALEQPGTPWEKLSWLFGQTLPDLRERPAYALVVLYALTNEAVPTNIRECALQQMDAMGETLCQLITEGQALGQVAAGDPAELTLICLTLLEGLAAGSTFMPYTPTYPGAETVLRILKP